MISRLLAQPMRRTIFYIPESLASGIRRRLWRVCKENQFGCRTVGVPFFLF